MKLKIIFLLLLVTLKISSAASFEFVGNWPFCQANAMAFDEARKHIYLASGGGVYVLDVSNPSNIKKVSDAIRTRGVIKSILLQYPYLYLFCVGIGLEIWKVDDLKLPERIGNIDTLPTTIKSIVFYENHLFLSNNDSIFVINISKNQEMQIIGRYMVENMISEPIVLSRYLLYQSQDNIQILDIKNPEQLLPMGTIAINRTLRIKTLGFALRKDTLYQANEEPLNSLRYVLKKFTINDFFNPKIVAVKANTDGFKMFLKGYPLYLLFQGPSLLKAGESLDFKINLRKFFWRKIKMSASDRYPKSPADDIKAGYVFGNLVYLLSQSQGLLIMDFSNIKEPKLLNCYPVPGLIQTLAFHKSNAIIAFRGEGMRVLDISEPSFIKEIFYHPNAVLGIKIRDNYLYTGNEIFDISNIKNPKVIGYFPGGVNYFEVNYPFVYGTCNNRFLVLDISEPKLVFETGSFGKLICYNRFAINYPYAFILSNNEIRILDISDSTFPFEIRKYKGVEAGDSRIILADSILCIYKGDKIYLFSLFNPPELENFYIFDSLPWINSVAVDNNYLYVVTGLSNLKVFRIILPDSIEYLGECPLDLKPTDEIFIKFPYIFLPTAEAGIQIIKFNP